MGLLDLPGPLFAAIDGAMATLLPGALRLAAWAAIAGVGTLLLYRLVSPQTRIGQAKREAREARRRLNEFDGEFAEAGPLIRDQFTAAFKHLGMVILPSVVSILPLLALLTWLETAYRYDYPAADAPPATRVTPEDFSARWIDDGDIAQIVVDDGENDLAGVMLSAPVSIVEPRHWWNWLIANPLGYLPDDSGIERIEIELPQRHYLPFGPDWMRSWLAIFLPVMLVASLITYRWARIQ